MMNSVRQSYPSYPTEIFRMKPLKDVMADFVTGFSPFCKGTGTGNHTHIRPQLQLK